ncbi:PREDICTED: wall-associated receptor kinase-like 8 [Theobroma cacao]|uniref:Wall-associated receptor kinase-like 8 n=1 Tax=Theobroma cacao TaxID=3641 RepID=A0AB32W9A5_THECC|nr:PREDICTED: wall-associated receptor kinase-like 8 [Theobroma cacao]
MIISKAQHEVDLKHQRLAIPIVLAGDGEKETNPRREKARMGIHSVLYSVLLFWLIQAGASQDGRGCVETCGKIIIPYPFGIKPGCYTNTWFRVTCNETVNGQKPFINRINLELLGSYSTRNAIVNGPVTYVNCGNKDNKGAATSVNLTGTPFFFPRRFNMLGSLGCGNLATFSNQTDPIGGCIQPRCGDVASKVGCYALFSENLTSYTANMTRFYPANKDSNRCSSVFMFDWGMLDLDLALPHEINIDTTHVPATLEWNPVKCDLEATLCQEPSAVPHKPNCTKKCGNVEITYPFGMEASCYMNDWFRVTCNETTGGPKPFISRINLPLLSVSFFEGSVLVNNSVTYFNCRNKENSGVSVNLTGSPFFFSNIKNRFGATGCGSLAAMFLNSGTDVYTVGGCLLPRCSNTMTSNGGCLMLIPPRLRSFVPKMKEIYPSNGSNRSCGSAFMIDLSLLDSYGTSFRDPHEISSMTQVPTTLQWATPKLGLCELREGSSISCSPDGQYCWTALSSEHLCVCSNTDFNIEDNYSMDGCGEAGKCRYLKYRNCHILCLNAPGNYCSSPCPDTYVYNSTEDMCKPIEHNSPTYLAKKSREWAIIIGCSTSIGTLFLLLSTWRMYKVLKRRKNIKLKQKYFKRNGGLLLQQQLTSNDGNVENIRLFTSKELEKATDYYNENRILGHGGQGIVYKGMLTDGSIVAIKKSKMVEKEKLDEMKLQQFINEVIILSRINHRNVVKLLGCCLEIEVPLLVYEFVSNGTLSQLIHDKNEEFPLTWEMRLRIATEIANALSYLHSAASVPIYHRDIKSSNILLDDKYRAKVSDFGISKSIALDQTHLTTRVQGTFGYLDPEYFRSSQFTEKSDVYSFGVVLVELLTGQKPVSSTQSEEVRSLVPFFLLSIKENSVFDILDPQVMNDGPQEEIIAVAKLAKRCLNLNGQKRPTMKQVATELERIKVSEDANVIQQSDAEDSDIDDTIEPWVVASCSTNLPSNA